MTRVNFVKIKARKDKIMHLERREEADLKNILPLLLIFKEFIEKGLVRAPRQQDRKSNQEQNFVRIK